MSVSHLVNLGLILIMLFLVGVYVYFKMTEKRQPKRDPREIDQKYTLGGITDYVKTALNDLTTSNIEHLGLTEEEFDRRMNQRLMLQKSLKGCTDGDIRDKNYVKNTIFDLLLKTYDLNEENINRIIPFDNKKALSLQDKFEIMLFQNKQKHGVNALGQIIDRYKLDELKNPEEEVEDEYYVITPQEIEEVFRKESRGLTFEDKLMIIVQRIYQQYKGFSVIDEIRDMKIDGVSGGVSGVPIDQIEPFDDMAFFADRVNKKPTPCSHDSVWILYKGKPIHMSFLSFGSEAELKRVCQNIYRYNNPGQLSESNGYKVNEMKDGSRIVVVRPGFSESWAFFNRKFDTQKASLEQLISQEEKNRMLVILLIRYLVRGGRVTAVTGSQGSGKTTLLMAMVLEMYKTHAIRVHEMAFELHLRKIFGNRNILTFRETDSITGQQGLDIQKKTDGTAFILGEVATDAAVPYMIQMAQQADMFFTHHARTFKKLVHYLRNSLLKMNVFSDEKIAEEQVVNVLNFDIHLVRKRNGHRFIERITECTPLHDDEDIPFDIRNMSDSEERKITFMETFIRYMNRSTNRKVFDERNIIEYREGGYVAVHPISDHNVKEMMENLTEVDQAGFKQFIQENWG
ncbi:pilus assembly protein CpaF [Paenibacillus illinoisensis]|uniref:pilus assembly protein CpaF n=1 Tax=Paenibacillus illinoisensis TaxID=59845 RepID=UPI001C8E71D6|nr:pilus assembly protein CpaF [Paenibacillus illinoisensis]MBY0217934.1 Flp pilus assembly complex ATPase component TadA [Paenibacillus illinoisensis]